MRSPMLSLLFLTCGNWLTAWDSVPAGKQVEFVWPEPVAQVEIADVLAVIEQSRVKPVTEPQPQQPRQRRVLYFTATWCGPCQYHKDNTLPWLRKSNWQVDESEAAHIQIVDWDKNPELRERYRIDRVPQLVLIEDGRELGRVVSPTRHDFVALFNGESK